MTTEQPKAYLARTAEALERILKARHPEYVWIVDVVPKPDPDSDSDPTQEA